MHIEDKDLPTALAGTIDGTPIHAAVYARMETAAGPARWLGPLGNYLIARPAARHAAHKVSEETDVPLDAAVVLGVTDTDLHVWSADPMLSLVKEHLGSVPLTRISGADAEVGKGWWTLTVRLDGGEALELSARGAVSELANALTPAAA